MDVQKPTVAETADPRTQARRILNRLESTTQMLARARDTHVLAPEEFNARDELEDRANALQRRFTAIWHDKVVRPFQTVRSQADRRKQEAEQQITQLTEAISRSKADFETGEDKGEASRSSLAAKLAHLEGALLQHERIREQAMVDQVGAEGEQSVAARAAAPQLNELRSEVDALLEEAKALYERLQDKRQLTAATGAVTKNREEFAAAKTYHREQASNLLWGTAAVPIVLGLLVAANMIWGHYQPLVTEEGHVDWPTVILVFGGRLSIVAALAWLGAFLGRLHARHAQQAVSYQNRLAALDIATTLLEHDRAQGRRETLQQMSAFYLTNGDNAFHGADPQQVAPADVEKWLRAVTQPIEGVVKALGRGEPKG